MKKPLLTKNNKLFWLYIILGSLCIVFASLLLPFWKDVDWAPWKDWSTTLINLILALFLTIYLFAYLLKRIIKSYGTTLKVLTIIEFTLLLLIDLYLILGHWIPALNIIPIDNSPCAITGLALYIRGVVEIFRAYFYRQESSEDYPLWWLVVSIGFISGGMWLLIAPFITNAALLWIFISLFYALGLLCIGYGIYAKPSKQIIVENNQEN